MLLPVSPALGVVLAVLLVFEAAVAARAGLGRSREILVAGVRAAVQLAAVSMLIGWVARYLAPLLGFVVLMFAVAAWTAGRRITRNSTWWWAAVPIAAGALPVVGLLLVTGLVPVRGLALIPVAGILIGGALTATVLGGRRALDELTTRYGEVEAGMALGMLDRDARLEIVRPAASDALLPGLDQTRTVGLVTLPGGVRGHAAGRRLIGGGGRRAALRPGGVDGGAGGGRRDGPGTGRAGAAAPGVNPAGGLRGFRPR